MLALLLAFQMVAGTSTADPFAFFEPTVNISADERRQLDRGESIARIVPGGEREVAVFASVPVEVDGDRLVAWIRRIEELKKSSYVLAIGRVSSHPQLEDFDPLTLDDEDVADIRKCRPGDCALKLSAREMAHLQKVAAGAADWKSAAQHAFRRLVFERVQTYLAKGEVPYDDRENEVWPARRFARLLEQTAFLGRRVPEFAAHLGGPPLIAPGIESFLYWSKERLAGKAIISVTQVSILRSREPGLPDALVASKEVFSTHYVNASLGLTAILRGGAEGPNYLAYLNRSEVDVIGGVFGGVIRWVVQRRLKGEADTVLQGLRKRLESGEPPPRP